MFQWLANRAVRKRARHLRNVFSYWNGERIVRADPIELWHKLESHPTYVADKHAALADEGDPESVKITCDAVQYVFGAKPYTERDDSGLMISEQLALLTEYYLYLDAQKKSYDRWLTSVSSTDSTSSDSSEKTTNPTSESGPTETEAGTGEQTE